MKTVCNLNQCSGCKACIEKCGKNAIRLEDNMRAYNAIIDEQKCINCGICHRVCQVNSYDDFQSQLYWKQGWAKNNDIRQQASSGGVASAIEYAFIKDGGCVCSCLFEKGDFKFKIIDNVDEISIFAGSKYVKSNPKSIYSDIQKN